MIQFKINQTSALEFYPNQGQATDGTAEVALYHEGAVIQAATAVPTEAQEAEVTANASVSDTQLAVDDSTGFEAGHRVLIVAADGSFMEAMLRAVESTTLYLAQPLRAAVASGSTVISHRLSIEVSSTLAAQVRRRCRADWVYEVGGINFAASQHFDIVREPFVFDIGEWDIAEQDPQWHQSADSTGAWRALIQGAVDDIFAAIFSRQQYPDLYRDRQILRRAVIQRFLFKFYMSIPGQADLAKMWQSLSKETLENALTGRVWYDADDSGGPGPDFEKDGKEDSKELGPHASYVPVG